MKYVMRDGRLLPKDEAGPHPLAAKRSVNVISDLEPFVSVVDGSIIGSRIDRREHNRRNGVIDVGDDPAVLRRPAPYEPKGLGEDIARIFDQSTEK